MKKATLDRYDCATRNHAKQYQDYNELDCTACMPFGGSGTHELVRNNPTATYILTGWQVEDMNFVLEYMADHDPVVPAITIQVVNDESINNRIHEASHLLKSCERELEDKEYVTGGGDE